VKAVAATICCAGTHLGPPFSFHSIRLSRAIAAVSGRGRTGMRTSNCRRMVSCANCMGAIGLGSASAAAWPSAAAISAAAPHSITFPAPSTCSGFTVALEQAMNLAASKSGGIHAMSSRTVLLEKLAAGLGPKGFTREPSAMSPWLEDWRKRYRGAAAALVSPATTEEVVQIVRLCAAEGVPLVPQGGNTSMVAGAIPDRMGESLLLSLRRMNRIRSVSAVAHSAVCEAGVILSDLHAAAAEAGRRFPLSLGAKGSATVGGLISTNAGGTQVLRFGTMRGLVQGLEAVLRTERFTRACPRSRRIIAAMI
jgi:hypothetical protein